MNRTVKKIIPKIILPIVLVTGLSVLIVSLGVFNPKNDLLKSHYETPVEELYTQDMFTPSKDDRLVKYAENQNLILRINPSTATISVEDTKNGKTWYSSPLEDSGYTEPAGEVDSAGKDFMNSTMSLSYYHPSGTLQTLYSYSDCVKKGQYIIKKTDQGADITYVFGNLESAVMLVPALISGSQFEEKVLANKALTGEDLFNIKRYYIKNEAGDYAFGQSLGKVAQKTALDIFTKIGIDPAKDFQESGNSGEERAESPLFALTLQLRVRDGVFTATVPTQSIHFTKTYPIAGVRFLEYFGAGAAGEDGYLLVPDGSGATIDFNNPDGIQSVFSFPVYGMDQTKGQRYKKTETLTASLPVFGVHKGTQGFLATIGGGASLATIYASKPASASRPFGYVNTEFLLLDQGSVILGEGEYDAKAYTYQKSMAEGNLEISYHFLTKGSSDYSAMAAEYRKQLITQNPSLLSDTASSKNHSAVPFYVEFVGAVKGYQSFLGLNYEGIEPLTTFSQAKTILEKLKTDGISDITARYTSYFNGGVDQSLPVRMHVEGSLGGKSGLKNLSEYTNGQGVALFTGVTLQTAYPGNGYQVNRQAARTMDERNARIYSWYNLITTKGERAKYIVSPGYLPTVVDQWLAKTASIKTTGVALNDLGSQLYQDYKKTSPITREESLKAVVAQLSKIKEARGRILFDSANAYAVPYASDILNIANTNSAYIVEDSSVPFYQMAIHGLVSYSGSPWNLSADTTREMLKNVEYGGGIYYRWIYAPSEKTKNTRHPELFSLQYEQWYQDAVKQYKTMNEVLGPVQNLQMTYHSAVTAVPGVTLTQYADGSKVYVNYTANQVQIDGLSIEANSFGRKAGE